MSLLDPEFMQVLGLSPPYVIEDVEHAFRQKARSCHPDHGGDPESFRELYDAYDKAKQYVRFRESRRDWLGELVEQYSVQEQLIRQIEKSGGGVVLERSDWMDTWLGRDFSQVTDRLVEIALTGLPDAEAIVAQILDSGAVRDGLRLLDVSGTHMTPRTLQRFDQLKSLEVLALNYVHLSLDNLRSLETTVRRMSVLQRLELAGNNISLLHRFRLRRRHRGLKFIFSRKAVTAPRSLREYRTANRIEYLAKEMYKALSRGQQFRR